MTIQYDNLTLDELRELALFDPEAKRALEARSGCAAPAAEPAEEDFDAASSDAREHADESKPDPMQDFFSGTYKHQSLHDLSVASRNGDDYAGVEYCERVLSESGHRTEQEMAIRELTMIRERFSLAYSGGNTALMPVLRHINLVLGYGYETLSGDNRNSDEAHQAFICYQNAYELDPDCRDSLLRCYEQGIGVDASFEKALSIRERAAENGGMEARMQVGALFLEQNRLLKAKEWFQYALEAPDHLDDTGSDAACRYLLDNLNGNPSTNAESLLSDPSINAWGYYAFSMTPGLSEGALENTLARGANCPESFAQQRCVQRWNELKTAQEARRSAEEEARRQEAETERTRQKTKSSRSGKKAVSVLGFILGILLFGFPFIMLIVGGFGHIISERIHKANEKPLSELIEAGDYVWDYQSSDDEMLRGEMTITQHANEMTLHVDFYPYKPDATPVLQWDGVIVRESDERDFDAHAELSVSDGGYQDVFMKQEGSLRCRLGRQHWSDP